MPGPYWCIRLSARSWNNRLYRLPPEKGSHLHIARSIYRYADARQTRVNWKKETTKGKEDEGKGRKEKKAKKNVKQKKRKRKIRITLKKDIKRNQGTDRKKNIMLADHKNCLQTALGS